MRLHDFEVRDSRGSKMATGNFRPDHRDRDPCSNLSDDISHIFLLSGTLPTAKSNHGGREKRPYHGQWLLSSKAVLGEQELSISFVPRHWMKKKNEITFSAWQRSRPKIRQSSILYLHLPWLPLYVPFENYQDYGSI